MTGEIERPFGIHSCKLGVRSIVFGRSLGVIGMLRAKYGAVITTAIGTLVLAFWSASAVAAELDLSGATAECRDTTGGTCAAAGWTGVDLGGGTYYFAGALWTVTTTQPTGSGYIDSFVRIQDAGGADSNIVDGHNTSTAQANYLNDEKPGDAFTHDVLSTDLQTTKIGSTDYYRFLLDINQTGSDPLLSLSGLQICTAGAGGDTFDGTCADNTNSFMKYDLDGSAANFPDAQPNDPNYNNYVPQNNVLLDYSKNSGSGSGDLWVYIPKTTLFPSGINGNNDYLYLWSQFGLPKPYDNNDGYEEWAFMHKGNGPNEFQPLGTPEPATLVMLGTGLLLGGGAIRRRNRRQAATKASN